MDTTNEKTTNDNTQNRDNSSELARELVAYEETIKVLADSQDRAVFPNSGKDHATIVLSNIFRTAQENIKIFAGDLCGDVSKANYLDELKKYLDKGNRLTVILEKNSVSKSPALEVIEKYYRKNASKVNVCYAKKDELDKLTSLKRNYHFTVADDRMYRFETDAQNYTAVCSFNDPATAVYLARVFETLLGGQNYYA